MALVYLALHAHALMNKPHRGVAFAGPRRCSQMPRCGHVQSSAVEEAFVQDGTPLLATPNDGRASEALKKLGIVRIDGVLDPALCPLIRQRILDLTGNITAANTDDLAFVPGTRLRFESAVQLPMDGEGTTLWTRNDVLLPLEDDLVAEALRLASCKLQTVLADGAASNLQGDVASGLELVELAALIARSGAANQMLHADFRRDEDFVTIASKGGRPLPSADEDAARDNMVQVAAVDDDSFGIGEDIWSMLGDVAGPPDAPAPAETGATAPTATSEKETNAFGQMPPRLVTFIYLQDVPTAQHGATIFLPGTANAEAHAKHLGRGGEGKQPPEEVKPEVATAPMKAPALLRLKDLPSASAYAVPPPPLAAPPASAGAVIANLRAGDAVVFDASCLHFGGANSVPDNERVVLYFGFARDGAAAWFDGGAKIRQATAEDAREPVRMSDCCAPAKSSEASIRESTAAEQAQSSAPLNRQQRRQAKKKSTKKSKSAKGFGR